MSRHGHRGAPAEATVPEPTFSEQARTLVHLERTGTLGTLSRRHPGHPFVSVMPYAPDAGGRPLLLISGLAMHTQNLDADPRASLLIAQAGSEDPLALARARARDVSISRSGCTTTATRPSGTGRCTMSGGSALRTSTNPP